MAPINSPPIPTNIIELRSEYPELVFKRDASCNYDSCDGYFLSGRFGYLNDGNAIIVCDLFTGTEKRIVSKFSTNMVIIMGYVHLTLTRGFIVYGTSNDPTFNRYAYPYNSIHASIISIDFNNGTYNFIGNSYEFPRAGFVYWKDMSYPSINTIMVECMHKGRDFKIHIFKLNDSFSNMHFQQSFDLWPKHDYEWNTVINGTFVAVKPDRMQYNDMSIVESIVVINDNNSVIEIKNTGVCFKANLCSEIDHFSYAVCSLDSCWHGTKFFVSYNMSSGSIFKDSSVLAIPYLWVFEMETRKWSEIRLNFPLNKYSYRFDVDCDGFLNFISYGEHYDADESSRYSVSLTRIPLKKPDKLLNLCWFKARKYGLSEKYAFLQHLI